MEYFYFLLFLFLIPAPWLLSWLWVPWSIYLTSKDWCKIWPKNWPTWSELEKPSNSEQRYQVYVPLLQQRCPQGLWWLCLLLLAPHLLHQGSPRADVQAAPGQSSQGENLESLARELFSGGCVWQCWIIWYILLHYDICHGPSLYNIHKYNNKI